MAERSAADGFDIGLSDMEANADKLEELVEQITGQYPERKFVKELIRTVVKQLGELDVVCNMDFCGAIEVINLLSKIGLLLNVALSGRNLARALGRHRVARIPVVVGDAGFRDDADDCEGAVVSQVGGVARQVEW
ncbi:hypothetical protein BJ138DRAFT_1105767 [Hygrophoropsis aurantiaca]|uniref:Uncharacterized protein n=1 Tax=Hygrophoropsis aurantiaca TaxID=72124 RepID=A0ACB7ZYA3_9AGAM|nr:hypothetical protein BJ138DRAFT_1105767 [Hygrophoropsis aurantiaca]